MLLKYDRTWSVEQWRQNHGNNDRMKTKTLITTAGRLRRQVERERRVVWTWARWKKWTRDEIEQLAYKAGVCFATVGDGEELRFFESP